MKNPVKKFMHKANCRAFIVPSRRQKLKDMAQHKESIKSVSDAEINTRKDVLSEDNEGD